MIDTQLLTDALATVGFVVALVIAISVWVVVATALHQRRAGTTGLRDIERHLADAAEQQTLAPTK